MSVGDCAKVREERLLGLGAKSGLGKGTVRGRVSRSEEEEEEEGRKRERKKGFKEWLSRGLRGTRKLEHKEAEAAMVAGVSATRFY